MIDDLHALTPTLASLGWNDDLDRWMARATDSIPGRVARVSRGFSLVFTGGDAVLAASASIRAQHELAPATGDFVLIEPEPDGAGEGDGTGERDGEPAESAGHVVTAIAPRATALTRRAAGRVPEPQVLAANLDEVFVMHGLDRELNLRRLERQLVVAWDSGATPVVVLTKADRSDDPAADVAAVQAIAVGVDVVPTSTVDGTGIADIAARLGPGRTVAMLGLSGIGKSTLVNALTGGAVQRVGEVRAADGRGRHTTVTRDLIPVPGGGFLIDTPGVREIGLWQAYDGLAATFPEIADVMTRCRFADCAHRDEPGCAVIAAIEAGDIETRRLEHWQDLSGELALQEEQLTRFERRAESRDRADAERRRDGERSNTRRRKGASRKGRRRKR